MRSPLAFGSLRALACRRALAGLRAALRGGRGDMGVALSYVRLAMSSHWTAGALLLGLAIAAPAVADDALVARGHLRLPGGSKGAGLVFFLPARDSTGAVAVGAAHSFPRAELAQAGEVDFRLGASGERVGVASRYYAEPGRAFHEPGATLRDDVVVFALDLRPDDVKLLEASPTLPAKGARVRIVGVPWGNHRDQDHVFGSIASTSEARIEVVLDALADLRGWGGAPVLDGNERVVGLLQAAWPDQDRLKVGVAPIGGVLAALEAPLDNGLGRPFAAYQDSTPEPPADPYVWSPPQPAPAPAADANATAAAVAPPIDRDPPLPPRKDEAPLADAPPPEAAAAHATGAPAANPGLRLEIEHPEPEAVLGDAAGAFVSGRAVATRGEFRRYDVVVVIDTSGSTNEATGVDVDGNGTVGQAPLGPFGSLIGLGSSDPGDSILAAEIAAARSLLRGLDPRNTRVALVTFAGEPLGSGGFMDAGRVRDAAITEEALTSDYARLERGLTRVRERGPRGMTHIAAGVDQATIELLGLRGALSESDPNSEKIVLFFTDGQPTLPYAEGSGAENTRAVLRAAQRARRAGIRIHSFAIGPEALAGPVSTVEMASITDGQFTPVRHPGLLMNVVEGVSFANVETVAVRNTTTGQDAFEVRSHADGSWDALVPLVVGKNELEVVARASDGAEARGTRVVHYAPGSADPYLPDALVAKRNELLEQRLIDLRRGRVEAERVAAEEARKELTLEIQRERAAAAEAADRQRKELELEVEDEAAGEPEASEPPGAPPSP
jgi:hypothetical protein